MIRTEAAMGTIVTIHVVHPAGGADTAIERAFGWFRDIEERCTRFDRSSELMRLCSNPGKAVPVSTALFEAVRFALLVAEETGGAFDPAVGGHMEARGFCHNYRTGVAFRNPAASGQATYRDVELDLERHTITLHRPLTLDLGSVAKGLAVDTAARELAPFADFAIDAGGDLYCGGLNPLGEPWSVGIRHPRGGPDTPTLIDTLRVSNMAVCTSGDYERGRHILDPRPGHEHPVAAAATVVAPSAMLADALATAAFVLGPAEGICFLKRMGVDGLILTPDLARHETGGLPRAA